MTQKISETKDQTQERTLDRTPENSPENSRNQKMDSKSETGAAGKGMPAQTLPDGDSYLGSTENKPRDAADKSSMGLPHERDQATDMTDDKVDPKMAQAKEDVDQGLKDTSKAVETDRTYDQYR